MSAINENKISVNIILFGRIFVLKKISYVSTCDEYAILH